MFSYSSAAASFFPGFGPFCFASRRLTYSKRSRNSGEPRLANGNPMIATPRARSSAKFKPSDSFAPMTANNKAPFFPSVGYKGQMSPKYILSSEESCLPLLRLRRIVAEPVRRSHLQVQRTPRQNLKKTSKWYNLYVPISSGRIYPTSHSLSTIPLKISKTYMKGRTRSSQQVLCSQS